MSDKAEKDALVRMLARHVLSHLTPEHCTADCMADAILAAGWQAQALTLREAADRWTQGAWSDVMLPKPTPPAVPVIAYANRVGDWLRERADDLNSPPASSDGGEG